jgi:hypothetical protein
VDYRSYLRFTIPILLGLLLNSCLKSSIATHSPTLTQAIPSPTLTPVLPSPSPDLSTFEPVLGLYTDREVEAFKERIQRLVDSLDGDPVPKDILERVGLNVGAFRVIDVYVGGCPTRYTYELSPSHNLVVDDNACFGYFVSIIQK